MENPGTSEVKRVTRGAYRGPKKSYRFYPDSAELDLAYLTGMTNRRLQQIYGHRSIAPPTKVDRHDFLLDPHITL